MNEEDVLDRLTATQEAKNPNWDHASKVVTCRDSLQHNLVSLPEARRAFGDDIVREALSELASRLAPESDQEFLDAARACVATNKLLQKSYPGFATARRERRKNVMVTSCLILVAAFGGAWLSQGNFAAWLPMQDARALSYSVPDNGAAEQRIQEQVKRLTPPPTSPSEVEKNQAEMNRLAKELEDRLIALEARKRVARDRSRRTSDAASTLGWGNFSPSNWTTFVSNSSD